MFQSESDAVSTDSENELLLIEPQDGDDVRMISSDEELETEESEAVEEPRPAEEPQAVGELQTIHETNDEN